MPPRREACTILRQCR